MGGRHGHEEEAGAVAVHVELEPLGPRGQRQLERAQGVDLLGRPVIAVRRVERRAPPAGRTSVSDGVKQLVQQLYMHNV